MKLIKKYNVGSIEGYDKLNMSQKNDFIWIMNKFLDSQGTDMRNNLVVKSVKVLGDRFRIDITRYGRPGYQILNLKNRNWS